MKDKQAIGDQMVMSLSSVTNWVRKYCNWHLTFESDNQWDSRVQAFGHSVIVAIHGSK